MLDINKALNGQFPGNMELEAHLFELEQWSELIAKSRAAEEGLALTEAHWDVIFYLRNQFLEHGLAHSGRELLRLLEAHFAKEGGRRYLFSLFPGGPVMQGCRIAGLPTPPQSGDRSFGSVM